MAGRGIVIRLGGVEFVLLWHVGPGCEPDQAPDEPSAAAEAQRVLNRLSGQVVPVAGHDLRPTGSLGIVVVDPGVPADAETAGEYLRTADLAMYAAKYRAREGGSPFHVRMAQPDPVCERRQGSRISAPAGSTRRTPTHSSEPDRLRRRHIVTGIRPHAAGRPEASAIADGPPPPA